MRRCAAFLFSLLPVLLLSATALAGNLQPTLFLEIYSFEDPADTLPGYVCTHTEITYPFYLPCSAAKSPYGYGFLAVHVGRLSMPVCPTVGAGCSDYGGFAGIHFGVIQRGEPVLFMGYTACPGFVSGFNDGPGDILALTAGGCHDWRDHPGYLRYINLSTNTGATYFRIVENATVGVFRVVNCSLGYDYGTEAAGCAAWGGTVYDPSDCYYPYDGGMAQYFCGFTPVETTSWGAIKSLFR